MKPAHWWALAQVLRANGPAVIFVSHNADEISLRLTTGDVLYNDALTAPRTFPNNVEPMHLCDAHSIKPPHIYDDQPRPI